MPRPKPLSPSEAKRTLVHRFGPRVNRLRQLAVRFGLNPYRVWLVWFQWTGEQIGEGERQEVRREEILPTPELTLNTRFMWMNAGRVEDGQFMLRRVDPTLGEALLSGKLHPGLVTGSPCPNEGGPPTSFLFLVREDGRSGDDVVERWFTLASMPYRRAGALDWDVQLTQVMHQ